MPTNFPSGTDTFTVPGTPTSTVLAQAGTGNLTHTQYHQNLGDSIMAMQAQATYHTHGHGGATFRDGNQLLQANTHQSPDTDAGLTSLHHTIGTGANQYAAGTHTHPLVATYPVGAFFFAWVATYPGITDPVLHTPGLGLVGTWTAVGSRFLCATGGTLGFTQGATGGSNSHNHTIDAQTNTQASHVHTLSTATTGAGGGHTHSSGGTTSTSVNHQHYLDSGATFNGGSSTRPVYSGSGSAGTPETSHGHTAYSNSPSHSHSAPTPGSAADHTHNVPSTTLGSSTTHLHNNSSPVAANNLIPLFVVYMWQRSA